MIKFRTIITFVCVLIVDGGFLSPSASQAFFSSPVIATANTVTASTLAFSMNQASTTSSLTPTATTTAATFTTTDQGTIAPLYHVHVSPGSCAHSFYQGLQAHVTGPGVTSYSGPLTDLTATTTSSGTWQLEVSAGTAIATPSSSCQFLIQVHATQQQFPTYGSGGFTASHTISVTLQPTTYLNPTVLLNEVLADPDAASTTASQAEYIELYNTTTHPVDVAGWQVSDLSSGGNEIMHAVTATSSQAGQLVPFAGGTSTVIPGHGWLALRFSGHASYLNNGGDTVQLYDVAGGIRDRYAYTASTAGVSEGRIPDGTGSWVENTPTPDAMNHAPPAPAPLFHAALFSAPLLSSKAGSSTGTSTASTTNPDTGGTGSSTNATSSSSPGSFGFNTGSSTPPNGTTTSQTSSTTIAASNETSSGTGTTTDSQSSTIGTSTSPADTQQSASTTASSTKST